MSKPYPDIPIIDRMSEIIDIIVSRSAGITSAEILKSTTIPKTTLYRLLASMTANNWVTCNEKSNLYSLGERFTSVYVSIDEKVSILKESADQYLRDLANKTNETVKLSILSNMRAYTVSTIESNQPIRISVPVGSFFPLHAGATGKILMLNFNKNSLNRYFSLHHECFTKNTIITPEEMDEELRGIMNLGYARDIGEYRLEIQALAVPIMNSSEHIIGALSVTFPSLHIVDEEMIILNLKTTANLIAEEFEKSYFENQKKSNYNKFFENSLYES